MQILTKEGKREREEREREKKVSLSLFFSAETWRSETTDKGDQRRIVSFLFSFLFWYAFNPLRNISSRRVHEDRFNARRKRPVRVPVDIKIELLSAR